jgi:hypothetical protein
MGHEKLQSMVMMAIAANDNMSFVIFITKKLKFPPGIYMHTGEMVDQSHVYE